MRTIHDVQARPSLRTAITLGIVELTCWGALIYTFPVFLPEMHRDLGWSQSLITAAYSFSIAVRAAIATVAGWWIDRRGAAGLMIAGSLGGVLILIAWSLISSPVQLFAVFLGIGVITAGVLYEPAFAIVVRLYPDRRNNALMVVTVLGGFASTIFLPATGALISWLGWRHALLALSIAMLAGAILPLALFVRDPRERGNGTHDPTGPATGIRPAARMAAGSGPYRWLTLSAFLISITVVLVNVYLVSYLLGQGYSLTASAAATGSLGILSVLGRVFLSQAARRIRLARLTGILMGCQALAAFPLLTGTLPGLVSFILLFGAGFGVITLARASLLAEFAPAAMYARWAGFQSTILTVAQVIAPVAGSLLHAWAGYRVVFGIGAAFAAAAAGSLFMADRAAQHSLPPDASEVGNGLTGLAGIPGRQARSWQEDGCGPERQ